MLEPILPANPALAALLLLSDVLIGGVALWAFRAAGERHPVRELWLGGVVVGAGIAGCGVLALVVFHNVFAVLRLAAHVLTFVGVPLALWRGGRRLRRGALRSGLVLTALGLGMAATAFWAHCVEPYRIERRHHRLSSPALAGLERPVRVAILADVQTDAVGAYEADVFARVAADAPDLVLLPGDFVQRGDRDGFLAEQARLVRLIESLDPALGCWAVLGDVDQFADIFAGTSIRVLRDEAVRVPGAPGLRLVGLGLDSSRRPLTAARAGVTADFPGYTLVMGHAPDAAIPLLEGSWTGDLLYVAGHTHGGQVVVPGFGPPLTLSSVPRHVAAGGLFRCGRAHVLVSRGVGHERGYAPRIRLFCRPEYVIVDLVPPGDAPPDAVVGAPAGAR